MEVILKETIPMLGQVGEIVKVKPGYARNYLLPRRLAVAADPRNRKELEHWKRMAQARQAKEKGEAEALAKKIEDLSVTLKKQAGEGDKIFGSVTSKEVVEALRKEEVFVDRRQVLLEQPIKTLGCFEVTVKLQDQVKATLKIEVVKE